MGISSTLDSYYYCNNYFINNFYYIEVKNENNNSFNYISNNFMDFKNNVERIIMIEEFIKKYAAKHHISIEDAKKCAIVQYVISFYEKRWH